MKRFFKVLFLSVIVVQLCLLPVTVEGTPVVNGEISPPVVTLPATDVSLVTATLNGSINLPTIATGLIPNRILPVSLQNVGDGYPRSLVSFQYGTQPGVYTHQTQQVEIFQSGPVLAQVGGLTPCTTYYYRLVLNLVAPTDNSLYRYGDTLQGAGVGLNYTNVQQLINNHTYQESSVIPGEELSFRTFCPLTGGQSSGGGNSGGGTGTNPTGPIGMSNIVVQSATVATAKVSPGEKVDIAASVTNKGGSNGTTKVTLYVNGQEAESKGITLSSGQSTMIHFSVSRNDPGSYTVRVNGVPAGSFTVDLFTNNDALIFSIIALFTVAIVGVLYLVVKRRTA